MKSNKKDTVDYAIDLGTNDSLIACNRNAKISIIRNYQTGEISTPSAVSLDDEANIEVGSIAHRKSITDPENATTEFKLNMGFPIKHHFQKADKDMLPEELSAEILKNLKKSATIQTHEDIDEILITLPANSNPLKTKATKKASQLAGFKKTHFIPEPIAAAYAYKNQISTDEILMIYDLGAGTFDAALVKVGHQTIEKIADTGIDDIGGKIFDWTIVDELFKKKIEEDLNINDFSRENPVYKGVFYRLKYNAEEAKKKLSTEESIDIRIEDLFNDRKYQFEYNLTRSQLEDIIIPYAKTTINTCNFMLWKASLTRDDIDRIILVGGSTLSPVISQLLKDEYGCPIESSINPLTVVVEGAARYASTITKKVQHKDLKEVSLILESIEETAHQNLQVKGRIITEDTLTIYDDYKLEIYDNKEKILTKTINKDGTFNINLAIKDEKIQYNLAITDKDNQKIMINKHSPHHIEYTPNTIQDTIQIGLTEKQTITLIKEGQQLDKTIEVELFTTKKLDKNTPIKIPIYKGKHKKPEDNILLDEIKLTYDDIKEQLPENTKIKLKLRVDEKDLHFNINLSDNKIKLDKTITYKKEERLTTLEKEYQATIQRIENIKEYQYDEQLDEQKEYLKLLLENARINKESINPTHEYIDKIKLKLDSIEEKIEKRILRKQIDEKIKKLENKYESSKLEDIKDKYEEVKEDNADITELEEIYIQTIRLYINENRDNVLKSVFFHLRYEGIYTNTQKSDKLINDSLKAIDDDDYQKLLENIIQLYKYDISLEKDTDDSDVTV